jgi:hypothetical protein
VIQYIVTYADGAKETVSALGSAHIRDWWSLGQCEAAVSIAISLRSETETDAPARQRGFQIQEWINPHSDKEIKSICIASGETGAIPIVLGVSALKP